MNSSSTCGLRCVSNSSSPRLTGSIKRSFMSCYHSNFPKHHADEKIEQTRFFKNAKDDLLWPESLTVPVPHFRHPSEGWGPKNPHNRVCAESWMPACAGMTDAVSLSTSFHRANSFSPSRINVSVAASSPAPRMAAATAAPA